MIDHLVETLDAGWGKVFQDELAQPYMRSLIDFLSEQREAGKVIYPPTEQWFSAFQCTSLADVKVVVVGQDPYHRPRQAHGLSFSVPPGTALPPSLKNIYKELYGDAARPQTGDLTPWAKQGVLLLNASLTVEEGLPGSHAKRGWLRFTEACIQAINSSCEHVVFLAWGRFAQGVCEVVDNQRHRVIKTSHPSPLGASKAGKDFCAFLGSGCFEAVNQQLICWNKSPIAWKGDA